MKRSFIDLVYAPGGGSCLSIEGGIKGDQKRFICEKCGTVFFAWRPETAPGVKVKCYFCKHEQEDEASRRTPPTAAAADDEKEPATPVP